MTTLTETEHLIRQAFERWMAIERPSLERHVTTYLDQVDINAEAIAWDAWRAALQSQSAELEALRGAQAQAGPLTDAQIDAIQRAYMQAGECNARTFARMIERAALLAREGETEQALANWVRDGIADFIEASWPHDEYWTPAIAERVRAIEVRPQLRRTTHQGATGTTEPSYVDCGECPRISTGCLAGKCLKAAGSTTGDEG